MSLNKLSPNMARQTQVFCEASMSPRDLKAFSSQEESEQYIKVKLARQLADYLVEHLEDLPMLLQTKYDPMMDCTNYQLQANLVSEEDFVWLERLKRYQTNPLTTELKDNFHVTLKEMLYSNDGPFTKPRK